MFKTEIKTVITFAEEELAKLMGEMPELIQKYSAEALSIATTVKAALASPEASVIEGIIAGAIPGAWEAETIALVTKAINAAIPKLIAVENASENATPQTLLAEFVAYLQKQTFFMQHAGLIKFISTLFGVIDPSLSEVITDTCAQTIYAKTTANK